MRTAFPRNLRAVQPMRHTEVPTMSEFNPRKADESRYEPHTCVLRLVRDTIPDAARASLPATAARDAAGVDIAQAVRSHRGRKRGGFGVLRARIVSRARSAIGRAALPAPAKPPARARPEFLGPDRYLIQFTTNRVVYEKLALASVLLGERKNPASLEEVVTIALEVLFEGAG